MKQLNIIESETPGITRLRRKVPTAPITLPDGQKFDSPNFEEMWKIKRTKQYNGKRVLKAYSSPWKWKEYFIRCFM